LVTLPRSLFSLLIAVILASCSAGDGRSNDDIVDAHDYDAFWLWAGVKPQPVLKSAQEIYILAGEVRAGDKAEFIPLRAPPNINHAKVWLVVRVETLDWTSSQFEMLTDLVDRWERAGNNLVGVQIDFDAETRHLDSYAAFLGQIREQLSDEYLLGVTGLMDWSANGDPKHIKQLAGVIDEVIYQTYQGRNTIPRYAKWMRNLNHTPMPFRIGLVQEGEWKEPPNLTKNAKFRGYVVFLLNPRASVQQNSPD